MVKQPQRGSSGTRALREAQDAGAAEQCFQRFAPEMIIEEIGAALRILKDRVTFSFGGVLQLVCHLERRANVENPRAYPRHHGLTFLHMEDFIRMRDHVERLGVKFLVRPAVRFPNSAHEHQTFMVADPSGNVVEFKCYVRPECSY